MEEKDEQEECSEMLIASSGGKEEECSWYLNISFS